MSQFRTSDQVMEFIQDHINPPAGRGLKGFAQAKKETLCPTMDRLEQAITNGDADSAKVNVRVIEPQKKAAQASLAYLVQASDAVAVLVADKGDAATAHLESLTPLIDRIAEGKQLLSVWIRHTDSLIVKADRLIATAARSERAAMARWSFIVTFTTGNLKSLDSAASFAKMDLTDAKRAHEARDAKALASIQLAARERAEDVRKCTFDQLRSQIAAFQKEFDCDQFSLPFRTQMNRDGKELGAMAATAKSLVVQTLQTLAEVERMRMPPPDPASAAKELGVPPKLHGQLKKAMHQNGSGLVKALDEIGKQAGMKTTGREMVAKLKRAKLVT